MAQPGKTTGRSKKPKTVPVIVLTAPVPVQQETVESPPSRLQLLPTPVQIEAQELAAKIHDFLDGMSPVTDSIFAGQSAATEVASVTLALAVTADGQVGLAGVVNAGLQVQSSITITLEHKKAEAP